MSSPGGRLQEVVAYESLDHIGSNFCLISIWKLQSPTPSFKCCIRVKSQFLAKKIRYFPLRNFRSLVLPRNAMLQLIIQFLLYCQMVAYGRLKTKENFKLSVLKVVAVVCERWSLTRGSKYSDLTWKLLVFWKSGR